MRFRSQNIYTETNCFKNRSNYDPCRVGWLTLKPLIASCKKAVSLHL